MNFFFAFILKALRLRAIGPHNAPLLGFAFHRSADLAVSFSRDGTAVFWAASVLQEDAFCRLFKARQQRRRSKASVKTALTMSDGGEPLAIATTGIFVLQ